MNDAANIISVFGWKIPVALFVAIVGLFSTLLGAITAAVVALAVNQKSNQQQTERLKIQLQHEATQKNRDREMTLRREVSPFHDPHRTARIRPPRGSAPQTPKISFFSHRRRELVNTWGYIFSLGDSPREIGRSSGNWGKWSGNWEWTLGNWGKLHGKRGKPSSNWGWSSGKWGSVPAIGGASGNWGNGREFGE